MEGQNLNDMPQTIYLVRHTTPAVEKGVCYGQSDLDITDGFLEEAAVIRKCLQDAGTKVSPAGSIGKIYSSPLQRCRKLAALLFPDKTILEAGELMEIHCGLWEMRRWDHIPREETDPWMQDFVHVRIPGGESYLDLYDRVIPWFAGILEQTGTAPNTLPIVLFTHGGVIRSLLSHITGTPLVDSFKAFSLHYGCVTRITRFTNDDPDNHGNPGGSYVFRYEILSNIQPAEKEQHKPGTGSTFAQSDHS